MFAFKSSGENSPNHVATDPVTINSILATTVAERNGRTF